MRPVGLSRLARVVVVLATLSACDHEEVAPPVVPRNGAVPSPEWPNTPSATPTVAPIDDVPFSDPEHRAAIHITVDRIAHGGPFPYRQDGVVFENREHRLPEATYGYYHEFTVPTPSAPTRGARRIVRGDHGETFYTDDHYRSFVVIDPSRY